MKAIILAAGVGSRIRPLTDNKPKSLLDINGETILERMIENIISVGIEEVIVITGYLEEQIKRFIGKKFPDLTVHYKKNDLYEKTNTGFSLLSTRDLVGDDPFIKFDADVVFEPEVLRKLVENPFDTALCIDRNINLEAEEVKVITDNEGKVIQVGKKLDPHKSSGESIGIEKIGKDAAKVLFDELSNLMKNKENWQEYYDDSYTTLVNRGVAFGAVDITGLKWVEIDTHEDYKKALEMFERLC